MRVRVIPVDKTEPAFEQRCRRGDELTGLFGIVPRSDGELLDLARERLPDAARRLGTVEVLRDFAQNYSAKEDRWLFLTGGRDEIIRFSGADGLKVGGHPDEPLLHSTTFTLVDRKGVIRGYYKLGGEGRMKKLRTDIRALLDEK